MLITRIPLIVSSNPQRSFLGSRGFDPGSAAGFEGGGTDGAERAGDAAEVADAGAVSGSSGSKVGVSFHAYSMGAADCGRRSGARGATGAGVDTAAGVGDEAGLDL